MPNSPVQVLSVDPLIFPNRRTGPRTPASTAPELREATAGRLGSRARALHHTDFDLRTLDRPIDQPPIRSKDHAQEITPRERLQRKRVSEVWRWNLHVRNHYSGTPCTHSTVSRNALSNSLTHSLTHSLDHANSITPTRSRVHAFTLSLCHAFTLSRIHAFTHQSPIAHQFARAPRASPSTFASPRPDVRPATTIRLFVPRADRFR